jgi:hypothetical protein
MEPANILFEPANDQRRVGAASESALYLLANYEVLGIEHVGVDQLERGPSMPPVMRPRRDRR